MSINSRLLMHSALLALATGLAVNATAAAQNAPIVQPGAPGEDVRAISAEEAVEIAANRFSVDDVRFMQDMILHHYQAVEMADLVAEEELIQALQDLPEDLETKEDIILQKDKMVQWDIILVIIPQVEVVVLVVLVTLLEALLDLVEMVVLVIPTLILRHLILHLL